ncbi:hypothetical protein D1AOALGA4SA_5450 [Olavius algarvensis Delta 1 endosymbiont]|nr:hypothetical protein D1AOALGA4SA_5450 [Olavius algarvensis Delta 1 endosymbiont]
MIVSLIKRKEPNIDKRNKRTLFAQELDAGIEFSYNEIDLDYYELKGKFEDQMPMGYNFSVSNRDSLPKAFTETTSVRNFIITLAPATNIELYQQIHNNTLKDIILPKLSPDFSKARIEAYIYKSTSYNSISVINTNEYDGIKIIDPLNLKEAISNTQLACNLKLTKTKINDKYVYIGNISEFLLEGQKYSGARILIPAKYETLLITKGELMELFSIPITRRIAFNKAYPELFELTKPYSDLNFSKISSI